jgi:hypothetical protein
MSAGYKPVRNRTIHFRLNRLEDLLPTPPDPSWEEIQARCAAMTDDELKLAMEKRRAELLAQLEAETTNGEKPGKRI